MLHPGLLIHLFRTQVVPQQGHPPSHLLFCQLSFLLWILPRILRIHPPKHPLNYQQNFLLPFLQGNQLMFLVQSQRVSRQRCPARSLRGNLLVFLLVSPPHDRLQNLPNILQQVQLNHPQIYQLSNQPGVQLSIHIALFWHMSLKHVRLLLWMIMSPSKILMSQILASQVPNIALRSVSVKTQIGSNMLLELVSVFLVDATSP